MTERHLTLFKPIPHYRIPYSLFLIDCWQYEVYTPLFHQRISGPCWCRSSVVGGSDGAALHLVRDPLPPPTRY